MDNVENTTGRLTFDDKVIGKIANISLENVNGILGMDGNIVDSLTETFTSDERTMKGLKVDVGDKQVALDLTVILEYNADARQVFQDATTRIGRDIERMTGLKLIALNLHVSDIMTQREWQQQKK